MRIYTKKAYRFVNPELKNLGRITNKGVAKDMFVETLQMGFHDVPDWVRNDLQFKRALSAGNIEIIAPVGTVTVAVSPVAETPVASVEVVKKKRNK